MLSLTETAVAAVARVLSGAGPDVAGLRIMVATGGCSGMRYELGLETGAQDGDEVIEYGPIKVFVDSESQPLINGMTVDYVEKIEGAGFVFENPNATDKCGCGKSFSC